MKVKLTKPLFNGHTILPEGGIIELSEANARELINDNCAEAISLEAQQPKTQKPLKKK